jgi:hypothetical protein
VPAKAVPPGGVVVVCDGLGGVAAVVAAGAVVPLDDLNGFQQGEPDDPL